MLGILQISFSSRFCDKNTIKATDQLFRTHVVKNTLSVLTVVTGLHDRQQQLRCIVLESQEENVVSHLIKGEVTCSIINLIHILKDLMISTELWYS